LDPSAETKIRAKASHVRRVAVMLPSPRLECRPRGLGRENRPLKRLFGYTPIARSASSCDPRIVEIVRACRIRVEMRRGGALRGRTGNNLNVTTSDSPAGVLREPSEARGRRRDQED